MIILDAHALAFIDSVSERNKLLSGSNSAKTDIAIQDCVAFLVNSVLTYPTTYEKLLSYPNFFTIIDYCSIYSLIPILQMPDQSLSCQYERLVLLLGSSSTPVEAPALITIDAALALPFLKYSLQRSSVHVISRTKMVSVYNQCLQEPSTALLKYGAPTAFLDVDVRPCQRGNLLSFK